MQVFKFGGASIKDARAVQNIAQIIASYSQQKLVIVVSAMGKTTNKLEEILHAFLQNEDYKSLLEELSTYHISIVEELFEDVEGIKDQLEDLFHGIEKTMILHQDKPFSFIYDAIISFGEKISSYLISQYLLQEKYSIELVAANELIRTNEQYQEAQVDWITTKKLVTEAVESKHQKVDILLTQGFIGGTEAGQITTLGREGSDFTAAIFASCLGAANVTIWKDVPGILNADPKKIDNATLYQELSYKEAAEMTYYGASVIHPKTIKPLANSKIPLLVRSFQQPKEEGTIIHDCEVRHLEPCIIMKEKQCLITFRVTDFSFVSEYNLSKIFTALAEHHIKINMMQNSAISFSVCVNEEKHKLEPFLSLMKEDFDVYYNNELTLITIKNYQETVIQQLQGERKLYLEQRTRKNYQMVVS